MEIPVQTHLAAYLRDTEHKTLEIDDSCGEGLDQIWALTFNKNLLDT